MVSILARRAKILVIDDDAAIVRLLTHVLQQAFSEHAEIEVCTDPADAQTKLDQGDIDILVTDLEMPAISGLKLLRAAKSRNAFTQVIFVTGHSSSEALLEALEFGATDYLLKPIDQQTLVQLIKESLSRRHRWQIALSETWKSPTTSPASEWI